MLDTLSLSLLGDYQHDFPLVARPYESIAKQLAIAENEVLRALRAFRHAGQISRIGPVWGRGAGGAAALCALSVPAGRLDAVAERVNREPGVNHNYEREHAWNLWYVLTGRDETSVRATAARIASDAGAPSLFLPMVRAYRVDLGFDLRPERATVHGVRTADAEAPAVGAGQRALAALAEEGLPIVPRPFDLWAAHLGAPVEAVLRTLQAWKEQGTIRRFGVVVRHHELGYSANAMTVVQVPPDQVDDIGAVIGSQPRVTLAYQRVTDPRWPYNLYFMVHGQERAAVQALVRQTLALAGAGGMPHETLFSGRRFKQTGGRYFAAAPAEGVAA